MRTGVILPSFAPGAAEPLAAARAAEAAGLDGVFCYDHLWPMGQPERPAIAPFPLLGAVASVTESIVLGTLVARVGLVPDGVLASQFEALEWLAPGRIIAGLGTGDHLSRAENESYGVAFTPAHERRAELARCARLLKARGHEVWIGGGAEETRAVAEQEAVTLNLWGPQTDEVARRSERVRVTWAGPVPGGSTDIEVVAQLLADLRDAGAAWAVFSPQTPLDVLAAATGS